MEPTVRRPPHLVTTAVLAVGVLAVSASALLIRESPTSSLATAFWRVTFSAALMGAWVSAQRAVARHRPDDRDAPRSPLPWRLLLVGGAALALHFWAWMLSVKLTTIAAATLFVTTSPLWLGLASRWIPGEPRPGVAGWAGILIAMAGGFVVATGGCLDGIPGGDGSLAGALWATAGAVLASVYFLVGRVARRSMGVVELGAWSNGIAAAVLLPMALVSGVSLWGYAPGTWLLLLSMAVIPQLLGHNAFNWALRYMDATTVSLVILLEPVGAALMAWAWFGEAPRVGEVIGGGILLAGIGLLLGTRARGRTT